jgi:hypothetical protein
MPFELGLAIAWAKLNPSKHKWFVCESLERRAQKSLSDLNGTDFNIHDGSPEGVMRELRNAFIRRENSPTVPKMMRSYRELRKLLPTLQRNAATDTVFTAGMFEDIATTAAMIRDKSRTA